MKNNKSEKTLGQAIDEIVVALQSLKESGRLVAIKAVCDHLKIPIMAPQAETNEQPSDLPKHEDDPGVQQQLPASQIDIRGLKENKQPASAEEMACVVAYYLQSVAPAKEKNETIGKTEIEKYFRQAQYPLRKRMVQVLVNAKASGYFDSVGRGRYRLNAVGYNLVAHTLPRKKHSR